jgi:hypothetical protein
MTHNSPVRRGFAASALVASVFLAAGCSSGTTASGTVTFDGQPLDGGNITFSHIGKGGEEKRRNASAEIIEGKYLIDASRELNEGKYRVEIYWHKKTGKQIMSNDPPNKIDETKQMVPNKYNTESKSTVDIHSGANTANFDVTSK